MKTISISGSIRAELGTKEAKKVRSNDRVPCVMYGGEQPIHFDVDYKSFNKIIYTPEVYNVLITIDGNEYSTVLRDVQFHPTTDRTTHADFQVLQAGKPVMVSLPIALTGASIGVKNGGKLRTPLRKLKVKGLLENIPDSVQVDITKIRIGQAIKVGSLKVNGLEFLDPASNVIVAVKTARGAVDAADEEEEEAAEATAEAEA